MMCGMSRGGIMKKGAADRTGSHGGMKAVLITVISVAANFTLRRFCTTLSLPFWFDTLGVLIEAYALGPVCGAIVGFTSNAMISFTNPVTLVYGAINAFIGITAGIHARRGGFRTYFSSVSYGAFLALLTSVLFTIPNQIFHQGSTDNIWGDAVAAFFSELGLLPFFSSLIGEAYLEFADKMLTVAVFRLLLSLYRNVRQHVRKRPLLFLALPFTAVLAAASAVLLPAPISVRAAEYRSSVDPDSCRQKVYNASNGLVAGHATAVSSSHDGSLWIGTYAGLYRFDGIAFEAQDISQIRSVNCLYTDDDGRLWVGTNDSGIVLLVDRGVESFADTGSGLCADSVRSIVQASDGTYYIGTSDYMERVELSDGIHVIGELTGVTFAKSLAADEDGNVAAVSEDGALFLIRDGAVCDERTGAEEDLEQSGESIAYSAVFFDRQGKLLAGTDDGVILTYEVLDGSLHLQEAAGLGTEASINDIGVLNDGTILVMTDQGLFRRREGSYAFDLMDTGTFTHSLQRMTVDYQGNIWIASTRDGLLKLSDSAFQELFGRCGISDQLVNACFRWQGQLYVGCDDGLVILDEAENKSITNGLTEFLDGTRVRYFAQDGDGRLYIATYGQGVIVCAEDGRWTRVSGVLGPGSRVRTLLAEEDGTVVASGENGISFLQGGKPVSLIPYGGDLGNAAALCFMETEEGVLAGTDGNGLFLLQNDRIVHHYSKQNGLSSDVILKIVPVAGQDAWFLVTSNSLALLRDGTIRIIDSFPYSNNYDILDGGDGRLYVMSSAGIYITTQQALLNDRAGDAFLVGPSNGFDYSLTVNSQNMTGDGTLYLCTGEDIVQASTGRLQDEGRSIRLQVRNLHVGDRTVPAEDGVTPVLPRNLEQLTIEAEAVNFSDYTPNLRYRLDGYEALWHSTDAADLREVVYNALPAGSYTFRLQMVNRNSGNVQEETTYSFRVEEPLQDTMLFKVYLIGLAIVFACWVGWYVTRLRMQRKEREAQREVEKANERVAMGNKAIISIARALYAKDQRTGQHSYNVAYYTARLGKAYGLSEKECRNLWKAALMHDIGKIAIPDAILNKPGRLTDEEYAIMKTHTTIGAEILSGFTLIEHVSEGARYHHERYDGRGYPDGIAGKDIPLYGRLIAVADAYDAMTANRIYREKQTVAFARDQIVKGRGTQFDPEMADLFLKLIDEGEVDPEKVAKMYENRDPEQDIV